ncbi:MAG: hypothetical protein NC916_01495, partial [Candidatus Omnitrophica bacterium]|nr:hypothetical protein [Candidatus Omnitrophota bacterium]
MEKWRDFYFSDAVTLLELIISILLLALIVFGFANIDFFSRAQIELSSRRAKLQNEVSFALAHMAKNIGRAIGNELIPIPPNPNGNNSVINTTPLGGNQAGRGFIDFNNNGVRDSLLSNRWIA